MRSILTLSGTQYSSLFVVISSFIPQKFKRFLFSTLRRVCVFRIGFLNMCSLYNLCRSAEFNRALDFVRHSAGGSDGFLAGYCSILSVDA